MVPESMDVVLTWVDGAWPGYQQTLARYATRAVDCNPNRTRDNLDLLKYALRSLAHYMPWLRRIFLVTARPQLPTWLNIHADQLRVVHHDQIFSPEHLPCFNSFAIVANVAKCAGVSRRFLYMEDDRLLGAPLAWHDLFTPCGRPWLYATRALTDRGCADPGARRNPWNAALAYSNYLLDTTYGQARRRSLKNAPVIIDVAQMHALQARYPQALSATRASRFRAPGNVAVEHLLPYDMLHRDLAVVLPTRAAIRATAYLGLDNFLTWQKLQFASLRRRDARFICLNDNYGARPRGSCVAVARKFLEARFPWPSPFEKLATTQTPQAAAL